MLSSGARWALPCARERNRFGGEEGLMQAKGCGDVDVGRKRSATRFKSCRAGCLFTCWFGVRASWTHSGPPLRRLMQMGLSGATKTY